MFTITRPELLCYALLLSLLSTLSMFHWVCTGNISMNMISIHISSPLDRFDHNNQKLNLVKLKELMFFVLHKIAYKI